ARGGAAGSRCRALRGGTRPGRGGLVNRHRRRAGRQLLREDGNALVEFVVLSAVLLIPALYLVLTLVSVQSAVFAADIIARDSARIHATDADPDRAQARARGHAHMVLADSWHGAHDMLRVSCRGDACVTPGGTATTELSLRVPLPGLGPVMGTTGPVSVSSAHAAPVDRYRAVP